MRLSVFTPCSRPLNLPAIALSLTNGCPPWGIWNVAFDNSGGWGHQRRNEFLDNCSPGWIHFIDDDNLLHPEFWKWAESQVVTSDPAIFIIGQRRPEGYVSPSIQVCSVDTAQVVFHTSLLNGLRFLTHREADGAFIEALSCANKDKVIMVDKELSYYNRLRW